MSDYVSELRRDLVEAAARQQRQGAAARVVRPLRPRAWSPLAFVGAATALAAVVVLVIGLRAVSPPRPPETPKRLGTFQIGGQPAGAVSAGRGAVVADFTAGLVQVGPGGDVRALAPPDAGTFVSLAADAGTVWAVRMHAPRRAWESELVKLGPDGRALARIPLGGEGGALAVGAEGVWMLTNVAGTVEHSAGLERIDPRSRRVVVRVPDVDGQDIAASRTSVWTREGGTVTQRDALGRVVNRVRDISPVLGVEGQRTMLADADGAWVVGQSDGLLYRIEGGQVVKRITVGDLSGVITRTRSAVWVTALVGTGRYELVRIDPDDGRVTARVSVGAQEPQAIVPVGRELWVITARGDVQRFSQE
jgi:hypothetical protein